MSQRCQKKKMQKLTQNTLALSLMTLLAPASSESSIKKQSQNETEEEKFSKSNFGKYLQRRGGSKILPEKKEAMFDSSN